MPERRRSHRRLELRIIDAVELKLEEQEIAGERRHPLVRVPVELRPPGVARIGGVKQRGVGHEAAGQILHRLVDPDRRGQRLARVRPVGEFGKLAAVGFGEQLRLPLGALEVGGEVRRVHAFVQVLEPPLRQLPEIRRRGRRRQAASREWAEKLMEKAPFGSC